MTPHTSPANRPTLQQRLLARLIAAIYGITEALIPIVERVDTTPVRPWTERMRFSRRFWAIIRELLVLTTRIKPGILSENPVFKPNRPKAASPPTSPTATPPTPPAASRTIQPTTSPNHTPPPLTARQLARRLALLLHQLQCLAHEAGAALTAPFRHHAALARAIAGCDRCPPAPPRNPYAHKSWERAG